MKNLALNLLLGVVLLWSNVAFGQEEGGKVVPEEDSAELFLEEYTDDFQETFFEALKQKGIQNYDRAYKLLVDAKQMLEEDLPALDHELAKTAFLNRDYDTALNHAVTAVNAEPTNYWFLDNMIDILDKESRSLESVSDRLPMENQILRSNLADIHYKSRKYNKALEILADLPKTEQHIELESKINKAKSKRRKARTRKKVTPKENAPQPVVKAKDPISNYRNELATLLASNSHKEAEKKADEAIEQYPLQVFFYLAKGRALIGQQKSKEAIETLSEGLDFIFDDTQMANDFYKELAEAHGQLGNQEKVDLFLGKIK